MKTPGRVCPLTLLTIGWVFLLGTSSCWVSSSIPSPPDGDFEEDETDVIGTDSIIILSDAGDLSIDECAALNCPQHVAECQNSGTLIQYTFVGCTESDSGEPACLYATGVFGCVDGCLSIPDGNDLCVEPI